MPEFCIILHPLREQRVQGKPGARCTRGLACNLHRESAHEHTGSAENIRPSLRNGFTAYFVLSPVTGSLATVAMRIAPHNLTPASGRQNHTTSPSASAALVSRSLRVHRIPPRVRDDRDPPLLSGETRGEMPLICPMRARGKFFAEGLARFF